MQETGLENSPSYALLGPKSGKRAPILCLAISSSALHLVLGGVCLSSEKRTLRAELATTPKHSSLK